MKTLKLELAKDSKKSSHALAGANIRRELKHKFPNCKFSVRTDSFSGGDSVHVEYVDGPLIDDVRAIVDKYQYGSFDGMTDCYNMSKEHDGSYGDVKYAHTQRSFTVEPYKQALEHYGYQDIEIKVSEYSGHAFINDTWDREREVSEYLHRKSFYTEPTITQTKKVTTDSAEVQEIYEAGTIEDYTHTKTQEILKVFKAVHKLSKESFAEFRAYMKAEHGAYYSRYAKGFVIPN